VRFWDGHPLVDLLLLATLLWAVSSARRSWGPLKDAPIPDAIGAGVVGFLLGPAGLGVIPFNQATLEVFVYHGLAIVFIAVALKAPPPGSAGEGIRTMAVAIPTMAVIQGILGLSLALALSMHPGFGLLLPLGFAQGPGQALAIGSTWEELGLVNGGQIGLLFAACGYATCAIAGAPLVAWAKRNDLLTPQPAAVHVPDTPTESDAPGAPGALDPLTIQLAVIGVVYLVTFGLLLTAASRISDPQTEALIWGFHFIVGSGVGLLARRAIVATPAPILDDRLLSRVAASVVDISTVAAFCAIQSEVFRAWIVPVAAFALVGGAATLAASLWVAKRGFPDAPFEHALTLFGLATGTLPTGLALLRIVDPGLTGPVARNTVLAATASIAFGIPVLLVVMPMAVSGAPGAAKTALALCCAYFVLLGAIAHWWGGLRFTRPLTKLWPKTPPTP